MTPAEWEIMKVIWATPNCEALAIYHVLQSVKQWQLSTVKTLLARLVKKGYLVTVKKQKAYYYSAVYDEESTVSQMIVSQFQNVCQKQQGKLLQKVVSELLLSQTDCQNIRDLLREKEKEAPQIVPCHCAKGQCRCKNENC